MAIVVIGGHSRSVGKTSVVASLISALAEFHWTALKITQYGHGICSANGRVCDCATADHVWAITEERDQSGASDSSRFLLAGAEHSLWVRTRQGFLDDAMPAVRARIGKARNVIMESNSVMKFLRPDLYIPVLDPAKEDFKASARGYLALASAVILHETGEACRWKGISLNSFAAKPVFRIHPPPYITTEIVDFVRNQLVHRNASPLPPSV